MKVRLNDVNGKPVEIYCDGTNELQAAIDVLMEQGVLPEPENGDYETQEEFPPAAQELEIAASKPTEEQQQRGG